MTRPASHQPVPASRRQFLTASAVAVGAGLTASFGPVANVHAAGDDTLKVGLIGCGGRGTGAAAQALNADKNVKLVALGDAFADRLQGCLATLKKDEGLVAKIDVPAERRFVGFDAYKNVIGSGVDVVLLASPPHFRPAHLEAAVAAGKHVFAEKPVAVDGPGVRKVLAVCEEAKRKNLSIVSGLCWRYHHGMRDAMARVHDGAVGDLTVLQCTYNTGALWHKPRQEGWSDMEWQLRNWLYFTWLSGDFNVEQHVHSLDKMAWAMKDEYPLKAVGSGGRQVRTGPEFGHIFDHHTVTYEFKNGVKLFSACRQQALCANDVSDNLVGAKGVCHLDATAARASIKPHGARSAAWRTPSRGSDNMYQNEHDELFASIRAGKPINNGEWMSKSTLMAIMGRMATYTGQAITWEQALNSKEDLTPARYDMHASLPVPPVASPGRTKFV